jgi:hypothetical protein
MDYEDEDDRGGRTELEEEVLPVGIPNVDLPVDQEVGLSLNDREQSLNIVVSVDVRCEAPGVFKGRIKSFQRGRFSRDD